MNKSRLIDAVKRNKFVYNLYYHCVTTAINILKLFVRTDSKLILFVSYGGRYFNDSPKCIYEEMCSDPRFNGYKLIWAFRDVNNFDIKDAIKIDSIHYFITAIKARCWVTNVAIERGLGFKGKKTFYFHTTHGTLPKLSGYDSTRGLSFSSNIGYQFDCSCAQSEIEAQYQLHMYNLKREQILVGGYPKNDILTHAGKEDRNRILKELGINENKKIILYAPTYREDKPAEMQSPVDFTVWEKELGSEYVVLYRAHPVVANKTVIDSSSGFVFDVSSYPNNSELMIASDCLISDYSGIFFEYAVLRRPMFCFAYDYDEYQKNRGLYFDIRDELPGGHCDEMSLLRLIKCNSPETISKVNAFVDKYVTEYGHATQAAVNKIYQEIKTGE